MIEEYKLFYRKFLKNFCFSTLLHFTNIGFLCIVSRYLPPDIYGDFSIFLISLSLLSMVLGFGCVATTKRFIPLYIKSSNWGGIKAICKFFININTMYFLIILLIPLILSFIIYEDSRLLQQIFKIHTAIYAIYLAPIFAVSTLFSGLFQSLDMSDKNYFIESVFHKIIQLVLTIYFVLILGYHTVNYVVLAILIAVMLTITMKIFLLSQSEIIKKVIGAKSKFRINPQWFLMSLSNTARNIIMTFIALCFQLTPELLSIDKRMIGVLAVILSIMPSFYIITSIIAAMLPIKITEYNKTKDKTILIESNKTALLLNTTINSLVLLIIIIFAKPIMGIFGNFYYEYALYLCILAVPIFFYSFSINFSQLLIFTGYHRQVLIAYVVSFFIFILSSVVFVPSFGLIGAIASIVIQRMSVFIYMGFLGYKYLGMHYLSIRT